ncbi:MULTISPECIES: alpha-L-arabinofuranosidase C-terminal domain-containing protein [unclassified Actinopolyspora]|uniref:alpha-L-arabinofuranosidase C-terminal domain-containing protein n=1 Tax=unclassified Actinopolyspora TaxID=2639451 RepID=UPI0013F66F4C|nr:MULTISPECIES: alpha-L-arabinofuranosidase C-terminal domain-containing protein [unclassified Actinopolyspora]NHD19033.1 hypothetical protein [Actinopolyspora sp. BKK2]NHE78182.1 hypothetical protein [Actinopolyspora sp. BKK1]
MSRLQPAFGLITAALLGATLAPAAAGASESPAPEHSLRINTSGETTSIPETMHGVFYEDINDAADGGLYAEKVRNRSFEYDEVDNPSYTPMTAWEPTSTGGASGTTEVLDDSERLNENNRRYLRLELNGDGRRDSAYGVTNAGYHSGMSLKRGEKYDFSIWARSDQPGGTPLSVTATDGSGSPAGRTMRLQVRGDEWTEYTGTFVAHSDTDTGGLRVLAHGSGTVRMDMVSLFPRETFKGEPNGLRKDLAGKIEALDPGFLRFPGGCLVNTGSHESYQAPDWERRRSYQWKDTVGPVEQRPTNANFWGYNQSYGLGFYEYFRFAENIGAMPLPVVPALVTGCGEDKATHDPQLLQRHIQDTLDLIQFANGSVDTEWGAKRAAMGHPEPFGLTHLAVGNEENLPEDFYEHFEKFRDAIEQRYPGITVVANSGPDDSGATFDRAWELAREQNAEMVDEHYYNNPQWFLENTERYDSYDRSGPKVSLTEFASEGNRFENALAEAAYMTGLERNADVVRMSSYAPLLAHEDSPQWTPDMIWFDNDESWGSTSYEAQKLFANNVGDEVVPSELARSDEKNGVKPVYQVVTRDERTGELIVKVVNARDDAARVRLNIEGADKVAPAAELTTLHGDPDAVNTKGSQPIRPEHSTVQGVSQQFEHTFPAHSISFMRIKTSGNQPHTDS